MAFSITEYVESLESRLRQMPHTYRTFFAMWCLHAMLSRYGKDLDRALNSADTEFVLQSFDSLWTSFINEVAVPTDTLEEMSTKCEQIENLGDYLGHVLFLEIVTGLVSVISVVESGVAEEAASMAEHVINCLAGELSVKLGRSPSVIGDGDLSSYPVIRLELDSQSCILNYLKTAPALSTGDLDRCRSNAV